MYQYENSSIEIDCQNKTRPGAHTHLQLDLESQKRISESLANSIIYFTIQLFLSRVLLGQCHRELVFRGGCWSLEVFPYTLLTTHTRCMHTHSAPTQNRLGCRLENAEARRTREAAKVNSLCAAGGRRKQLFESTRLTNTLFISVMSSFNIVCGEICCARCCFFSVTLAIVGHPSRV